MASTSSLFHYLVSLRGIFHYDVGEQKSICFQVKFYMSKTMQIEENKKGSHFAETLVCGCDPVRIQT